MVIATGWTVREPVAGGVVAGEELPEQQATREATDARLQALAGEIKAESELPQAAAKMQEAERAFQEAAQAGVRPTAFPDAEAFRKAIGKAVSAGVSAAIIYHDEDDTPPPRAARDTASPTPAHETGREDAPPPLPAPAKGEGKGILERLAEAFAQTEAAETGWMQQEAGHRIAQEQAEAHSSASGVHHERYATLQTLLQFEGGCAGTHPDSAPCLPTSALASSRQSPLPPRR